MKYTKAIFNDLSKCLTVPGKAIQTCLLILCLSSINAHAAGQLLTPDYDLAAQSNQKQAGKQSFSYSARYDSSYLFDTDTGVVKDVIVIPSFDGSRLVLTKTRAYFRPDGKLVWLGHLTGKPDFTTAIIASENSMSGFVRTQAGTIQVRYKDGERVTVKQASPPDYTHSDVSEKKPKELPSARQASSLARSWGFSDNLPKHTAGTSGFSDSTEIKVLVYYISQTLENEPDLLDMIELEFIDSNESFVKSGIDASVSIAGMIAMDTHAFTIFDTFGDLDHERHAFKNVDQLRDKYNADIAYLFAATAANCGEASYSIYPDGYVNPEWAKGSTSTSPGCMGTYVTAHELGHVLGARHDRYAEGGGDANSNYGYVDMENNFRTVMAYQDLCRDSSPTVSCPRIENFSNPDVSHEGAPTGVSADDPESADNARMLNFSAKTVANYRGVARPRITAMSNGSSDDAVSVTWAAVDGAEEYRLERRPASFTDELIFHCDLDINYSIRADYNVSSTEQTDTGLSANRHYCYTVKAMSDDLVYDPDDFWTTSSLPRLGYTGPVLPEMPFIEDIVLSAGSETHVIDLSLIETGEFSIDVVHYNGNAEPSVSLTQVSSSDYQLSVTPGTGENQTLALLLVNTWGSAKTSQQFYVHFSGAENVMPVITGADNIQLQQNGSVSYAFTIDDDGPINDSAIVSYSTNKDLLSTANDYVTHIEDNRFELHLNHDKLAIGQVDFVLGYHDGELFTEKTIPVEIVRSVFTQTEVSDAKWYVEKGGAVERLLPFIDADYQEALTVEITSAPEHGTLEFVSDNRVIYTADEDFERDSFEFHVTGEDGVTSEIATVTLVQPSFSPLAPNLTVALSDSGAFVTDKGELYVWGQGREGRIGLGENSSNYVFSPTKVDGENWVDASMYYDLYAIKSDGTLWVTGRQMVTQEIYYNFVQVGEDTDWVSVQEVDSDGVMLTKRDGSVWGIGSAGMTNRDDVVLNDRGYIEQPTQLIPLYGVELLSKHYAVTQTGELYSWGGPFDNLGRPKSSGYVAKVEGLENVSEIHGGNSAYGALADGNLYFWGDNKDYETSDRLFAELGENYIEYPTPVYDKKWRTMALSHGVFLGIDENGALWSVAFNDVISAKGRSTGVANELTQIGDKTDWVDVWVNYRYTVFALDSQGVLWAAGGEEGVLYTTVLPLWESFSDKGSEEVVLALRPIKAEPFDQIDFTDTDTDGIADIVDADDDNDGVKDTLDAFPKDASESSDFDGDGMGDNADKDDDNDLVPDAIDAAPLDGSITDKIPGVRGDMDGDRVADLILRNPRSFYNYHLQSSTGNKIQKRFGLRFNDIPVTGDFDGDGISDLGVRRIAQGRWFILYSSTGQLYEKSFGNQPKDIPVPADYDGDMKTDIAIRRPTNGRWYILQSSNGKTRQINWGSQSSDIPVHADYDGDGKTDVAIRRPSNAGWYILQSSNGQRVQVSWGNKPGDVAVPADYDGDGKADIAVFRPSENAWIIRRSLDQKKLVFTLEGESTDIPVQADYDGDGIDDPALRTGATGKWRFRSSKSGDIHEFSYGANETYIPMLAPALTKMEMSGN